MRRRTRDASLMPRESPLAVPGRCPAVVLSLSRFRIQDDLLERRRPCLLSAPGSRGSARPSRRLQPDVGASNPHCVAEHSRSSRALWDS